MKPTTFTLIIASIAALVSLSLALGLMPANAKSEAVLVLPDTVKANEVPAKHVGMGENQPL